MTRDIETAKALLKSGDYTCVLCKGDTVYASTASGISPMIEFLSAGTALDGFSAADKVVGKAAALLFVLAGIREVYAPVMSQPALNILSRHGIAGACDHLIESIMNRKGTGLCPMEKTVGSIDEPTAAFEALKNTLDTLQRKEGPK